MHNYFEPATLDYNDELINAMNDWPMWSYVKKRQGYDWPGRVCGINIMSNGKILLGVENRLSPGTCHVFVPSLLEGETRRDTRIMSDILERML